jgi:RHH-type proline utilization regulon transcriptional repressor/proline dehydrogenase/delta 1-pyrroline-5-carboxylate dehydrogenase
MKASATDRIIEEAVLLAETWQRRANELLTPEEKGIAQQMRRLVTHPMDKVVLTKLIDQSFRSENTSRVADQVSALLREYGVPDFFSSVEKLLVQMFMGFGRYIPSISVPKMIEKMRHDSSRAVIPGEPEMLKAHLRMRQKQGVRMNINYLGEAILGETEARKRMETYIKALEDPEIEYLSVKISTIYSQINSLAFAHSVAILKQRLSRLLRTARDHFFVRNDGSKVAKFVNLDMEEYRDLEITATAFVQSLDQQDLQNHAAGIALQAYLPDSFQIQKELTAWARARLDKGGSPVKIRIVKGANMEMEQLEAALHNWPLALYDNKLDVDANFKRMVDFGMMPDNIRAANLGIASHNLFELAYAFKLAQQYGVTEHFSFEMLKGMADHVRRAIQEISGEVVVYAPVATRTQFINAIGYLVRRLDENTAEENFLRHSFDLKPESKTWAFLKNQFIASCYHKQRVGSDPFRTQNRSQERYKEKTGTFYDKEFHNEPDTDWSLKANRNWAEGIRDQWQKASTDPSLQIPLVVGGEQIFAGRPNKECMDRSQLPATVCVAVYAQAVDEDIERALMAAASDPDGWRRMSMQQRHKILSRVAVEVRRRRGDLIGAAAAGTGKTFAEADPEVSEAVDFLEYYPFSANAFVDLPNVKSSGKGVGLVISPWNFPIAIPCGGITAALATGNTVIFKPSSAAVLPAWLLCQAFWNAGVSKNVLQFLPCSGDETGAKLVCHPDVDFIILTGSTETGMNILKKQPGIILSAETGGKNATIVTAISDRGQAIKHVLHSALSNCGQKCSATSLLILEKEVYQDRRFREQLIDATRSYAVGSVWHFENTMGPLIHPPKGDLQHALTQLEPGESWALQPENIDGNPNMWTPGIKWGVQPTSVTHTTEFFGPLLGVMCADNLDHAIDLVNQTGYGLTSAIESLDKREYEYWQQRVKAGNLYINRGTTGAIVLRQPFGGMGKSALGAGIKAGGPNYVAQFMNFEEIDFPQIGAIQNDHELLRLVQEWRQKLYWGQMSELKTDLVKTIRAVKSYLYHWEQEFSQQKDYFHLRGQDNVARYLPAGIVLIRVHPDDSLFDTLARIAAAKISGNKPEVSITQGLDNMVTRFMKSKQGRKFIGDVPITANADLELVSRITEVQRIRYAKPARVPSPLLEAAAEIGFYISRTPVMMEGRIELLQYLQEQSISHDYHRYGNLGERALQ